MGREIKVVIVLGSYLHLIWIGRAIKSGLMKPSSLSPLITPYRNSMNLKYSGQVYLFQTLDFVKIVISVQ